MIDWEMKARQMAENLQVLAVLLGIVAIAQLLKASSGWEVFGWVLVAYVAWCSFADARI